MRPDRKRPFSRIFREDGAGREEAKHREEAQLGGGHQAGVGHDDGAGREEAKNKEEPLWGESIEQELAETMELAGRRPSTVRRPYNRL